MPYKRRDVALNDDTGPIDRTGGEEISLSATGGLYVEQMDVGPIEISFDDSVERFPIYSGRQFGQKFTKFKVHHGAIGSGTLRFITFEKGEDIFDGTPLSANPFDSVVAEWDDDIYYPSSHNQISLGINGRGLNSGPYRNAVLNDQFMTNVFGAGSANLAMHEENLGINFVADMQVRYAVNLPIRIPLTTLQTVPIVESRRVFIDTFYIALTVAPASDYTTGIQYSPSSAGALNWIDGGNPGYGLFWIDSASSWAFATNTGAFPPEETTAIPWPVPVDTLAKLEVVHLAATPTARAILIFYVNDVEVLRRTWEPGSVLPDYSDVANSGEITRNVRAAVGGTLFIGGMRCRAGKFDALNVAR